MSDKKKGVAFGFIPILWDGFAFEGRWWWCDLLLDFSLAFVNTFMPDALDDGVPLKIYEDRQ